MAETPLIGVYWEAGTYKAALHRDHSKKTGLRDISSRFHFDRLRGLYNALVNFQLVGFFHISYCKLSYKLWFRFATVTKQLGTVASFEGCSRSRRISTITRLFSNVPTINYWGLLVRSCRFLIAVRQIAHRLQTSLIHSCLPHYHFP